MNDAYKVAALQSQKLSVFKGLFLATLGGAKALHLDAEIGSFDPGKFADFVVWHTRATPQKAIRAQQAKVDPAASPSKQAHARMAHEGFGMMMLGDDRSVEATWVSGVALHQKSVTA